MPTWVMALLLSSDPESLRIMRRLAENQEKALDLRRSVVYRQSILARMHRGNRQITREHDYLYDVSPTETRFERKLVKFQGKFYDKDMDLTWLWDPDYQRHDEIDFDASVLDGIAGDLTGNKESRDGLDDELFPLTTKQQELYEFRLLGEEEYRGRPVYKLTFAPARRSKPAKESRGSGPPKGAKAKEEKPPKDDTSEEDEGFWEGEVLVDRDQYQPVLMTAHQAKGLPLAVKILLGTDIKRLGFKVTYRDFGGGLWFPETYGGEFEVRVLFGYHRRMSISMANSDLKRVRVDSTIQFTDPQ